MTLERWTAARAISREQLESQPDATIARGVSYERIRGVDRIHAPGLQPGHFYFAGDELRMVYLPEDAVGSQTAVALAAELGPAERTLRSRAGKDSRIELHAAAGVAYSHKGDPLEFVEVFPPTTVDAYLAEIYEDPGPFIR